VTPRSHYEKKRIIMTGRIDVHSHLLPGIDDGCKTLAESLDCARMLVENGYTHSFCTSHIWPSYPNNNIGQITVAAAALQIELDANGIELKLLPGGELNFRADLMQTPSDEIITYAMQRKFALVDMWADKLPPFFEPSVKWLQSFGITVILAHPERMRAVQDDPNLADYFAELGILLQGNLGCFGDSPTAFSRRTAEILLEEDRYFMLGTDLHSLDGLPQRMTGLKRVEELAGTEKLKEFTIKNPSRLL
jgi:protein-tyrosine phosphatase